MSDRERLARLTNLLYGLAAVMFGGTILELLAAKHYQDPVQLIPFALCGVGVIAVLLAWQRPGWATVQALRVLMLVTAAATLLGIWKHIEGNIGFIREMHPATTGWPLLVGALTGRAPLLASGVLAASATTAIAATFAAGWSLRGPEPAGGRRLSVPERPPGQSDRPQRHLDAASPSSSLWPRYTETPRLR
jgi:hypothetical protein